MLASFVRPLAIAAALTLAAAGKAVEHRGHCTVVPWMGGTAPTISVRVNGDGPFTFVVDTGAEGDAWIKPELAARLHLPVAGKVPPDGPDDPEQDLRLFAGKTLQVGELTFLAPMFGEMLQMGPKPQPFDGIIGSDLFARLQVVLDYRNRQLQVTERSLKDGQAVTFDRGMPVVPLTIGKVRVLAHLDTGNIAGALFVEEAVGQVLPLAGPPQAKGKARTHYGEQSLMEASLAARVRYGETILPIDAVRWPPAIGISNLGSRGMRDMVARIDARARRLAITPAGKPLACS